MKTIAFTAVAYALVALAVVSVATGVLWLAESAKYLAFQRFDWATWRMAAALFSSLGIIGGAMAGVSKWADEGVDGAHRAEDF